MFVAVATNRTNARIAVCLQHALMSRQRNFAVTSGHEQSDHF